MTVRASLGFTIDLAVSALALVWRRALLRTTVIAITGSTGKTTAKECLAAILSRHAPTTCTVGNVGGRKGLPRTVLHTRPRHRFLVAEVAILEPGIMRRSALLVRPDVVVMLTINWQHSANFPSLDAIAAEKAKLIGGMRRRGVAILNADDPRVLAMADAAGHRVATFGTSPRADVWADEVAAAWPSRLQFRVHVGDRSWRVHSRLVGTHWLPSVLGAMTAAFRCEVPMEEVVSALASVEPFTARLQPVPLPQGATLLRDEYNGSMATLLVALRVLAAATARRRVAVIGRISDARESYPELADRVGREVAAAADVVVFVGPYARRSGEAARAAGLPEENVHHFEAPRDAAGFLRTWLRADDLVLMKAVYDDHLSRMYFAQLGTVGCWKAECRRPTLCDQCPELGYVPAGVVVSSESRPPE